ncbi:MAG: hypothetical protein HYW09_00945 [Candidatus Niyogibacteria bacterium]|nr:hypothetical protein [Candidatus Niyogibacteria bacterium]
MPEPAEQVRIIMFLDVNAGEIEKELKNFSPLVKIVRVGHRFHRLSDRELIRRFEKITAENYSKDSVFVLTHDQRFEEETGFKLLESPITIIKLPSPSLGKCLFKQAVADLKSFLDALLSFGRPVKFHGVICIE